MKILQISKLPDVYTRYDLEIEDTHNFVAEGIVVHNTSAHISWKHDQDKVILFSGGEKYDKFEKLFNTEELKKRFKGLFDCDVTIFGEAYGGKCQSMSETYGKELKFIVFDVKVDDSWLDVPNAEDVAKKLNLEFVAYAKVKTDLDLLNTYKNASSVQADRNGCGKDKMREGIVLRPIIELTKNNGNRIIVKHKNDEFKETKTKREVNPDKLKVLEEAFEIAEEWVTPMRLSHVLDKLKNPNDIESTGEVIKAMIEDVLREAEGEIIVSGIVKKAIGKKTAKLFKNKISLIKTEEGKIDEINRG